MFEIFIGLEIHLQLLTRTKAFCACRASFGDAPNTHVCEICLGYPGVLPCLNKEAVRMAYLLSRALSCDLQKPSRFDRKNYFYPDMPKNYQITQFHTPVGRNGFFDVETKGVKRRVDIRDVHLEEDAGKMIHEADRTLLDYNRAGIPLLEVVTEPVLKTPEEAECSIRAIRRLVRYLRICDGNMEEGSLRCDVNVSVNRKGFGLGAKVELKNLNSPRFVRRALAYEIGRQLLALKNGVGIAEETRLWSEADGVTKTMRVKEGTSDYRYFPEPDLLPFMPDEAFLDAVEAALVELPLERKERFVSQYNLRPDLADLLIEERETADYFEEVVNRGGVSEEVAKLMGGPVQAELKRLHLDSVARSAMTPARLVSLSSMISSNLLSGVRVKEVIRLVLTEDKDPETLAKEGGFLLSCDLAGLYAHADAAILDHPKIAERIRAGDPKTFNFLVGEVMKRSGGTADPKEAARILRERLSIQSSLRKDS